MRLRPYQETAADKAISALRRSIEPIMIEAATGAGKSLIIAAVAHAIHEMTGKRILVIAPSAELVLQDREKYTATGNPSSVFSATAGAKSLRHPVVFGSPLTVKNRISAFASGGYALVIVDECDLLTPSLRAIIEAMREGNSNLRVLGLTATPYRLGSGYIFREWPDGTLNGEDKAREPYFSKCVYRIEAKELIVAGYLTPPIIGAINSEGYDTHALEPNRMGKFASADIDRAYHGHGRKTAAIVGDIVRQSRDRQGVLIYAATKQHAREVMASLPAEISAIITDDTSLKERRSILSRLRSRLIKYVVNVGVLTVGVDVPHIDVIAVLRKTESIRLLQQIIGRGLRLSEGKTDCLYLDYTSNLEDHCPDGDLFAPVVRAKVLNGGSGQVEAECPDCGYANEFSAHKDASGYVLDKQGYCLDVFGARIETDFGPMPGHHGRRCFGMIKAGPGVGEVIRCSYRWTSKPCPTCEAPNDIAARYCIECKAEIVDPNEKLAAEFKAMKRDPTQMQTDMIVSMECTHGVSPKGNATLRVDFTTEYRRFSVWLLPEASFEQARKDYQRFMSASDGGNRTPSTVSYRKDAASGFYRVYAYDQEADILEMAA